MSTNQGWAAPRKVARRSDTLSNPLRHRCQTLARGPNLARSVIIFGPRGNTK